jgi:organic hydroperoxide reductase OsmC/OhrA
MLPAELSPVSRHTATVRWTRSPGEDFSRGRYSRAHSWAFDGGAVVRASASPDNVPPGTADAAGVDPEEAFIAAISSCHMLFFIDYARRDGFVVDSYSDEATGIMEKRPDNKIAVTSVTLRPKVEWAEDLRPGEAEIARLHHRSHEDCFIANSVNTKVTIEP